MIDISDCDRVKLIQKAFELSKPLGLGLMHYNPNDKLTPDRFGRYVGPDGSIFMDYVNGRAVKFKAWVQDGKLFTDATWRDHTPEDLSALLEFARS